MRIAMACVAGWMAASGLSAVAQPAVIYRVVLKSGDPAPGLPGKFIHSMGAPRFSVSGDLVVNAWARVSTETATAAIYGERDGVLRLVAWTGMPVPGLASGITLTSTGITDAIKIDPNGNVYFTGTVGGPGVNTNNDQVLMVERNGALQTILREGDPAPGFAGRVTFGGFASVSINSSGKLAFTTKLAGVGITLDNDDVVYIEGPAGFVPVQEGWPAPGYPSMMMENLVNVTRISDEGMVAFNTSLRSVGGSGNNSVAMFSAEELRITLFPGDPSQIANVTYGGSGYAPGLTADGVLLVSSWLNGPGVTSSNNVVTLIGGARELRIFLREGDAVPGYPEGAELEGSIGVLEAPVWNPHGELVTRLSFKVPPLYRLESALFTDVAGPLRPLGLHEASVPRLGPGMVLGNPSVLGILGGNRMAVRSQLNGPGVNSDNNECYLVRDVNGELYPVAREDQDLDLGGGDVRTMRQISIPSDWPVYGSASFRDDGSFAFLADFSSGTYAAIVATPLFDCPLCAADFDGNGGVEGGDIAAFIVAFEGGDACADVDRNGGVDGADVGAFFALFEAGGC